MELTNVQKQKVLSLIGDCQFYEAIVADLRDLNPEHPNLDFYIELASFPDGKLPAQKKDEVVQEILDCGRPRQDCRVFPIFQRVAKSIVTEETVQTALKNGSGRE
jgi:hypothetical protein